MDHFKANFKKVAFDPFSLMTTMALPSAGKRFSEEAFDHAKRKGMGLPTQNKTMGKIIDPVLRGLDRIDSMDEGFKKKVLKFSSEEGPAVLINVPAKRGRRLGKSIKKLTDLVPFGVSQDNLELIARLTDSNEKRSGEAVNVLKKKILKARGLALKGGAGVLGILGLTLLLNQNLKKERGPFTPPYV